MALKAVKGSMQISASRTCRRAIAAPCHSAGFTLLELLVVVSLASILTGVVVLGFTGADTQQQVKGYAERFAFRVELARQQALNRNREWGIYVEERAYSFAEFSPELGEWEERSQRPFDIIEVPDLVSLRIDTEGVGQLPFEDEDLPQILVFSSGEVTPFILYLEMPGDLEAWVVSSDGLSRSRAQHEGEYLDNEAGA
jgi:type II secretion system protein H